jgi:hypothetical protein
VGAIPPTITRNQTQETTMKRKNITKQLVASCTPGRYLYVNEYPYWIQAILDNVQKEIGKPLTSKQVKRIKEHVL